MIACPVSPPSPLVSNRAVPTRVVEGSRMSFGQKRALP